MGCKQGERKTDLSDESTAVVLKKSKTLIRSDWGGQMSLYVIKNKLKELHANSSITNCRAVKKIVEEQIAGCRKRVFPRVDEAIKRVS